MVRALVTVPFVLPTVVVGAAFVALLGPGGPLGGLGLDQTVWAILLAHVFFNYAVVLRTVGGLWAHLDPRQEDAARVLGASRWRAFREVTLPALRPALAAATAIVFLFTFTSFGVILVLGGPRYATLETEIYRQTAQLLNLDVAAALTVVQMLAVVALLVVDRAGSRAGRRSRSVSAAPATPHSPPRTRGARWSSPRTSRVMLVVLGAPLLVMVERAFDPPTGYGFDYFRALDPSTRQRAVRAAGRRGAATSLRYAAIATLIAVVVGGLRRLRREPRRRRGAARQRCCRCRSACRRSPSASGSSSRSTNRHSTCARPGSSCPSRRHWSPSRSSCAP